MGFGGYHQIIKIKNSIKSGDYTTDIDANWLSTGNATDPRRGTLIGEGTSGGTCGVLANANLGVNNDSDIGFDGGPWPTANAGPDVEFSDHEEILIGNDGSLDAEEDQVDAAHDAAFTDARMGGLGG